MTVPPRPFLDHRVLNTDMSVFATDSLVGSGLPLWLPAGAAIRRELERLAEEIALSDGCLPVYSPVLAKRAMFEQSGHWSKFGDDMFPPMRIGDDELVLRPANCPHHAAIYAAQPHTYRDLPIRLHELAPMFRAERSGALSGLSRVRQIALDDTHVFCRPDQIEDEVARALRSALDAQRILGLDVDLVRISRRGEGSGYLGDPQEWLAWEAALRAAAAHIAPDHAIPVSEAAGEAAFYGPKLDLQVRDGRGREETIATVQLDLIQPERFDLGYISAGDTRERPVMIHCGTVGSMERVVASLLERHQGRLPLWLAPVQVCILPVSERQRAAAQAFRDDLARAGLRCAMEVSGSLGARIRVSRKRRDAVIAVIGDAEAAAGGVHLTDHAVGFRGMRPRVHAVEILVAAYRDRAAVIPWD